LVKCNFNNLNIVIIIIIITTVMLVTCLQLLRPSPVAKKLSIARILCHQLAMSLRKLPDQSALVQLPLVIRLGEESSHYRCSLLNFDFSMVALNAFILPQSGCYIYNSIYCSYRFVISVL